MSYSTYPKTTSFLSSCLHTSIPFFSKKKHYVLPLAFAQSMYYSRFVQCSFSAPSSSPMLCLFLSFSFIALCCFSFFLFVAVSSSFMRARYSLTWSNSTLCVLSFIACDVSSLCHCAFLMQRFQTVEFLIGNFHLANRLFLSFFASATGWLQFFSTNFTSVALCWSPVLRTSSSLSPGLRGNASALTAPKQNSSIGVNSSLQTVPTKELLSPPQLAHLDFTGFDPLVASTEPKHFSQNCFCEESNACIVVCASRCLTILCFFPSCI